ncbi:MAG TPA: ABC transporter transmembrane domain-containing protein, partial [Gemmataceae bacterium]
MNATDELWGTLPADRRTQIAGQLQTGETLLAWFEPDLDLQLRYAAGLVVLTDRRVLSPGAGEAGTNAQWQSWPLTAGTSLRTVEHGGAGTLELVDDTGRLAFWRYTAARGMAAQRLVQKLASWHASRQGDNAAPVTAVCPSCGAPIRAEDGRCEACAAGPVKPSVSALFRLMTFARPRAGLVVLGFVLTVASTAAGLVPPGLTQPLIDKVLIPYQTARESDSPELTAQVNFNLVWWYLGGLVVASLLAWGLDWARLYVLAWVSERISADLRTRTYGHLQRLSLEFFGGKRTGDLIARISNDTE